MEIGGGTLAAIRAIVSSEIMPGPLGMAETRPKAEAPQAMASWASAGDLMQQILILGRICRCCTEIGLATCWLKQYQRRGAGFNPPAIADVLSGRFLPTRNC